MQNGYGKTVVAPVLAARHRRRAGLRAAASGARSRRSSTRRSSTIRTMPDRLAKVGDLFAAVFENQVKLPKLK